MGHGSYSQTAYDTTATAAAATPSKGFTRSHVASTTGVYDIDPVLDPLNMKRRDCIRTVEHPNAKGILVGLDVTGSMGSCVHAIFKSLPSIHTLLTTQKSYVPDAQLCWGFVGDVISDHVPLQISQFESGMQQLTDLMRAIIEGNGGGHGMESYELLIYAAARLTYQDCWQDGEKGYLFIIGDELARDVSYDAVAKVFGKAGTDVWGEGSKGTITFNDIVREAQEKYEIFFILPTNSSGGGSSSVLRFWKSAFGGENVIEVADENTVPVVIASTIALREGAVNASKLAMDLASIGSVNGSSVMSALVNIKQGAGAGVTLQTVTTTGTLGVRPDPTGKIN